MTTNTRILGKRGGAAPWLVAVALCGCGGSDDDGPPAPVSIEPLSAANCALGPMQSAVAALTGDLATSISAASLSPAGATADGQSVSPTNPALPEHCVVTGIIDAHVGDPNGSTAYGNRFRLRMPSRWNGRFYFMGGGGNNGTVADAVGRLRNAPVAGDSALLRGFAVVAQDSGHAGSSPTFALDEKAYVAFAHRSVHDASVVTKTLIASYFGSGPRRSYFVGCSNGGREAMVSAQRYADFDGLAAGNPALNMFDQWMQDIWNMRIMAELVGTPAGAVPASTSAAYSDAQLSYVAEHFRSRCDALDGVADGVISNYVGCAVTPADLTALQCAAQGGTSTDAHCLGSAQTAGLRKFYSGPINSAGTRLYPGFYPGGVETVIRGGMLGSGPTGLGSFYATVIPNMPYMGYGFRAYPGAASNPASPASYPSGAAYAAQFNFDIEPARLEPGRLLFHGDNVDPARPGPNYESFRQRGGKLLIYTGTADPSVQGPGVADFMDRLHRQYTPQVAAGFARAFFVPGMNHCEGGRAADRFDVLTPLVEWVENGIAPERIVARAVPGGPLDPASIGIARPLCPYPTYARYDGSGDRNAAGSYLCAAP